MTRDEAIASNPIVDFLDSRGIQLIRNSTHRCPVSKHRDGHLCVHVEPEENVWFCNDCGVGGSVVDWLMREKGIPVREALDQIGCTKDDKPSRKESSNGTNGHSKAPLGAPVAEYDYTDAAGRLLYQVVRFEPKTFRQRRPDKEGGWIKNIDGITRVLYNLPAISKADFVWVVEGEKDANLLNAHRQTATTNAGGAGKWEPQYNEQLAGKDVIICGDNDKPGQEHVKLLQQELGGHARSIRVVRVPDGYKDVSEFCASFERPSKGVSSLLGLAEQAEVTFQGKAIPVQTMEEMEIKYREFAQRSDSVSLNLGHWIPSLAYAIRPLVPGEMVCIVADTGVGKTMLLQNIALKAYLPTLLFEIELPGTLTFERFAGIATKTTGRGVFDAYREKKDIPWRETEQLKNIAVCCESRLTPADLERIINGAGIKTGTRPVVVMVDYVQLIRGAAKSRYENMSLVAEELKVIAKATNTILIIASQIARKDEGEIGLHDAKDSGSIENSCGLVLGAWRDGDDKDRMMVKVLKNTKGHAGRIIPCRIFDSLLVAEEAKVD